MLTFWNITSNKLNNLVLSNTEDRVIFVTDTEKIYVDFNGVRSEYRNMVYVQDINNIPEKDARKNLIYLDETTKKLYYYINDEYIILNPDNDGIVYIRKIFK